MNHTAFRAAHLRTVYRKRAPVAAAGDGEDPLTTDPVDAASGFAASSCAVIVGPRRLGPLLLPPRRTWHRSTSPLLAVLGPTFLPFALPPQ